MSPDDPQMRELSAFLREQGVDPYAMERYELELLRKCAARSALALPSPLSDDTS